jgi:hypothetical protein
VTAAQRAWCLDHQLPDLDGGPSVAASARQLGIASSEVERALDALEATTAEGVRLIEASVKAEVTGDRTAIEAARLAYRTWQTEVAFPAQKELATAMGAWSTTPEWAEACGHAFDRRGSGPASAAPSGRPDRTTAAPTAAPTPTPKPKPKPTPRLAANGTINYTSSTYVGRLIELTIRVRNPGTLRAGKLSVQVEGVGYSIRARTPLVGCVPNCRSATGVEGVSYVEWTAPAPGSGRAFTVQLRAKRAGSYRIEVRAYRGAAGDPLDELASWTVTVRVR